jgi:hypothetical protein
MGKTSQILVLLMMLVACEKQDPPWSTAESEVALTTKVERPEEAPEASPEPAPKAAPPARTESLLGLERRTACEQVIVAAAATSSLKERLILRIDVEERCALYCAMPDAKHATCEASRTLLAAIAESQRAAAPSLRRGDRVSAQWPQDGRWYPGTIAAIYSDDTADIAWYDGTRTNALPLAKIRFVKRPLVEKSVDRAAVGGRPSVPAPKALVEGSSCAGPGWQYVCGGRCTDVKVDSMNCGSCGHRCDAGYSCDGSGTCRDASGRL